jgi:hypothetical protein
MRPTWTFVRGALAGAAALALLTACGGGSSDNTAATTSKTTTSAAPTTAAGPTGADAAFCSSVTQLVTQLGQVQAAPPQQAAQQLKQLVINFDGITPPAAIQADWRSLGNGLHQLEAAVSAMDLSTSQGQAQFQQAAKQATAAAAAAQGNISTWVLGHCGGGSATTAGTTAATTS